MEMKGRFCETILIPDECFSWYQASKLLSLCARILLADDGFVLLRQTKVCWFIDVDTSSLHIESCSFGATLETCHSEISALFLDL